MTPSPSTPKLTRGDRWRLSAFVAAVAGLHALGWGLFLAYSGRYPALAGLGVLAYSFGLRHAFDADHIAAIDNTTRRLRGQGKRPLGIGFFFSLGHSAVVFGLAAGLAVGARTLKAQVPVLRRYGDVISAGVSGTFLWLIGLLNLIVLLDIARMYGASGRGRPDEELVECRLEQRGFMSRLLLRRFGRLVSASWQMFPVGFLFGLGFDTATEVALLALATGAASHAVPLMAVMSLPVLFAAGMSMMDTADGALMSHAYGWAFSNPSRKVYYNLTVTSLSVAVALAIGSVELLQVAGGQLGLDPRLFARLDALGSASLGFAIVGAFALAWAGSLVVWRLRRGGVRTRRALAD